MPPELPHITNEYLASLRKGEEVGFSYFFNTYYKTLCFFANSYVKNRQVAEEIAEDGFMKIWDNREKFIDPAGLRSYLYKTVYHSCLRWLENKQREVKGIKDYTRYIEAIEMDFSELVFKSETLRMLKQAMDQLPAQCKKVFFKLYIEGKTVAEAAAELRLTISTINNQKARGIKLLKLKFTSIFLLLTAGDLLSF